MAHVSFNGRLGGDPRFFNTNFGEGISFSAATNTGKDETLWFDCVGFGQTYKYLSACNLQKGDLVTIWGNLKEEEYQDKSGQLRKKLKVKIDQASVISSRRDSQPQPQQSPPSPPQKPASEQVSLGEFQNTPVTVSFDDDDIPF